MMGVLVLMVSLFGTLLFVNGSPPPLETCVQNWEKVGCFKDEFKENIDRVFPNLLVNHRGKGSAKWDGHTIEWSYERWPLYVHALTCKCAQLSRERGWDYFGLQFYGECWGGPSKVFDRDGPSTDCVGHDYKPCDDKSNSECVGQAVTNYVYKVKKFTYGHDPVNGAWAEWGTWSTCSASCNGGERSRTRECTNPPPMHGGHPCVGTATATEGCNQEACEAVCKSEMDIGIILDASTSVTRKHWVGTLKFVNKLSKILKLGEDTVRFGVIKFSWFPSLQFSFSDKQYWQRKTFESKVAKIRYTYGGTRTDRAIEMAQNDLMCAKCGTRNKAHKALLVLTDGVPSLRSEPMEKVTAQLKKEGVKIVAVGVGSKINSAILSKIATDPDHVLTLSSYDYLDDPINKLVKLLCSR